MVIMTPLRDDIHAQDHLCSRFLIPCSNMEEQWHHQSTVVFFHSNQTHIINHHSSPLINISNINHHAENKTLKSLNNNIFEGPQQQKITFHHQRPIFSTNAPDLRCQAWPEPMESGWDCDVTLTTERQQLASRYANNQPKATNKKQDPGTPNIPNLRSACFDATGHQSR